MTIAKDASRPSNQHRASTSSMASSLPARNSYSRNHSHPHTHSLALGSGSYNPTHRVTRRKSTTLNAATSAAAISAAINIDANGEIDASRNRRSISSVNNLGSLTRGSYPSPPSSLPQQSAATSYPNKASSTLSDGLNDKSSVKGGRGRRASDAPALVKKKSAHPDLKCETCGKGYKHSSCLTKHLWEHTPEWQLTSKLLISKHQQVQLLEAASVLMAMNVEPTSDSGKMSDSENSSASPDADGFDSREDEPSSAETTPPPQHEASSFGHRKNFSNGSSFLSPSYQSNYSEISNARARQSSVSSSRPPTAQTSVTQSYPNDERDQDMAAAMGLLNCASSYKSPLTGPLSLASDVPPVPELPQQYRALSGASYQQSSLSKMSSRRFQEDVDMEEDSYSEEDDKDIRRIDEADEGVFGNMEE
ncbi:hypothetical protein AAFC00_004593 [Neodothiora populina]|uniref:C2H2-type domain-containing protein n=1 Tax=Neodothiora populina TaxID=2781224 RepID=A0ABR3P2J0_9PEZI